eukprot:3366672-Rhodomonas_salina.1
MACESLTMLQAFKTKFLTHFEGTDEAEVTTYLGCKLIRNRADRTILFRQAAYASKILQLYCAWDKQAVKTGVLLSKADSPKVADPELHCRYRGITGHLSFLITMTRCNL